ncbi:hypothetical protein G6F65_017212 [Rhizopus arrhizus]|nr:hypothetical protein G6F65_017212 [Rhizopus arrhizus]
MSAVQAFLQHLQVERRMSAHTLDAYRRDLDALSAWAEHRGMTVEALDAETLRQFVADEHRRGLSAKSLQRRLSACRSFYAWLLKHGRIEVSPAATLKAPRAPRRLPQVLDADEAVQLGELEPEGELGRRDRALLEALCFAVLRRRSTYDAALQGWMQKPLSARDADLRTLLMVGFAQLDVLELPAHAALSATVDAARALGRERQAGLVNAILRRAQREGFPEQPARDAFPEWLAEAIERDWPAQAEAVFNESLQPAPLAGRSRHCR